MAMKTSMTGADATWLHMDRPTNLMVVNTVLTFDDRPDWAAVQTAIEARVVGGFARFRQRAVDPPITLGLARPVWRDADHEPTRHFRHVSLTAAGSTAVHDHVAREARRPLPSGRPLWQAQFIETAGGGGAVLLRTHHALADGVALMHVLEALDDDAPRRNPARPRSPWRGVTVDASAFTKLMTGLPSRADVLNDALGGTKRVSRSRSVPLESLKRAGAPFSATVNDVALALIAGALRRYLEPTAVDHEVQASIPVNLRPRGEAVDDELGNHFGLIFAKLPIATEPFADRVVEVKRELDAIKATREAALTFDALTTCGFSPTWGAQQWVDRFAQRASLVITNVAGPDRPLRIAGAEVADVVVLVPTTGPIGVGLSICSYAGRVRIGIIVDTEVVADVDRLRASLDAELTESLPTS